MKIRTVLAVSVVFLSGCATIRYGRMQPVSVSEHRSLDCPAITAEITKCIDFRNNVYAQFAEHGGKRWMGYAGDFGIGNNMEMNDALESANDRRRQLQEIETEKRCSSTPSSAAR